MPRRQDIGKLIGNPPVVVSYALEDRQRRPTEGDDLQTVLWESAQPSVVLSNWINIEFSSGIDDARGVKRFPPWPYVVVAIPVVTTATRLTHTDVMHKEVRSGPQASLCGSLRRRIRTASPSPDPTFSLQATSLR